MTTANSFSEARSAIRSVGVEAPSWFYPYRCVLPGDGLWHTLNEDGFGYFPAGTHVAPVEGDRAILSVSITNRQPTDGSGLTIELGSWDHKAFQLALPLGSRLLPGETRIVNVSKLSSIAVRNVAGAADVTLDIELVADDR